MRHPNQPETIYVSHKSRHNSSVVRVGIGAFVLIGFLAWIMPFYTLILFGVVAGPAGFYIGVLALVKGVEGAGVALLKIEDIRQARAKTMQMQNQVLFIDTKNGTLLAPGLSGWEFRASTVTERREQQALLPATVETALTPLLDKTPHFKHVCWFGPTGSGKTSAAVQASKQLTGRVLVIDPKAKLNSWPEHFTIVSNPDLMAAAVAGFVSDMDKTAQGGYVLREPYTLIIDEIKRLKNKGINLYGAVDSIAGLGRELGYRVWFTAQAMTAEETDFNAKELKDNFQMVKFTGFEGRGHRCFLGDGKEAVECLSPMPPEKPPVKYEPGKKLLEAFEIYKNKSLRASAVFHEGGDGGNQSNKMLRLFKESGLIARKD